MRVRENSKWFCVLYSQWCMCKIYREEKNSETKIERKSEESEFWPTHTIHKYSFVYFLIKNFFFLIKKLSNKIHIDLSLSYIIYSLRCRLWCKLKSFSLREWEWIKESELERAIWEDEDDDVGMRWCCWENYLTR
jgi:hypothetical protein